MRVIRLIVNWLVLLTVPIWLLPCILVAVFRDCISGREEQWHRDDFFYGTKWLWESR